MRSTTKLPLALTVIFVTSCAAAQIQTDQDPCTTFGFQPIRYTEADVEAVSGKLARSIAAHNRKVEELCGRE